MPSQHLTALCSDNRLWRIIWLLVIALINGDKLVHGVQVVNVEGTGEVIQFMLDGARQEPMFAEFVRTAGSILRFNPNALLARDLGNVARD
jgi:hypothetical protein